LKTLIFKIALLGNPTKETRTTLFQSLDSVFNEDYKLTIGVAFYVKTFLYQEREIKLQMWDLFFEKYHPPPHSCQHLFVGTSGILFIIDDNTNNTKEPFKEFDLWSPIIQHQMNTYPKPMPLFLVKNISKPDDLSTEPHSDKLQLFDRYIKCDFTKKEELDSIFLKLISRTLNHSNT
jgi:hypothetical protein